jgi:hypothetical protein
MAQAHGTLNPAHTNLAGAAPVVHGEQQNIEHVPQGGHAIQGDLVPEAGTAGTIGTHTAGRHEQAGTAGLVDGQNFEGTAGISAEERERQLMAEEMRLKAREEKLAKQADTYVEKKQRDAHAHVQHEMAKADKNAEKAIAKAAHKEANVHKKVENKLAEAAQDRKKAEIDAEHKAAEKKAAAQQEAEDIIAAAKEKAEAIKRGEEVAEKPSTIKKILGMS